MIDINKFGMVGHGTLDTKKDTLISMIKMLGDEQRIVEYVIVFGYRNIERKDNKHLDVANVNILIFK